MWLYLERNDWKVVPPEKILDKESIDGKPYLFADPRTSEVLCFVKPSGGI